MFSIEFRNSFKFRDNQGAQKLIAKYTEIPEIVKWGRNCNHQSRREHSMGICRNAGRNRTNSDADYRSLSASCIRRARCADHRRRLIIIIIINNTIINPSRHVYPRGTTQTVDVESPFSF